MGVTSIVIEGRLCGILTSRDKVSDIPDVGIRVNEGMRWGSMRDAGSTLMQYRSVVGSQ